MADSNADIAISAAQVCKCYHDELLAGFGFGPKTRDAFHRFELSHDAEERLELEMRLLIVVHQYQRS